MFEVLAPGVWPAAADLALFATAVLVLNATPGVDLLLTISRTLQGGAPAGVAAALGINLGCVVHALAAAFGLAAMLAVVPAAFQAIQWAGAAYLMWLGLGMLRRAWHDPAERDPSGSAHVKPTTRSVWLLDFRTGLLTNLLNPKVAIFFLAFLPQFVPATSQHKTASFLLLGLWFVVQSTLFLLALVAVVQRLRSWGASARLRRLLHLVGGGLFLALALRLLKERPTLA